MAHFVVCMIVWAITFLLIPVKRIGTLWRVIVLSVLWMILLDNLMTGLGYYSYENNWLPIGNVSVFQLITYPGVGILMINWLSEKPMTRLASVIIVAMLFSLLGYFYNQADAFRLGRFDAVEDLIYCIAALSVFLWLALAVTGDQIREGRRTNVFILSGRHV